MWKYFLSDTTGLRRRLSRPLVAGLRDTETASKRCCEGWKPDLMRRAVRELSTLPTDSDSHCYTDMHLRANIGHAHDFCRTRAVVAPLTLRARFDRISYLRHNHGRAAKKTVNNTKLQNVQIPGIKQPRLKNSCRVCQNT